MKITFHSVDSRILHPWAAFRCQHLDEAAEEQAVDLRGLVPVAVEGSMAERIVIPREGRTARATVHGDFGVVWGGFAPEDLAFVQWGSASGQSLAVYHEAEEDSTASLTVMSAPDGLYALSALDLYDRGGCPPVVEPEEGETMEGIIAALQAVKDDEYRPRWQRGAALLAVHRLRAAAQ